MSLVGCGENDIADRSAGAMNAYDCPWSIAASGPGAMHEDGCGRGKRGED